MGGARSKRIAALVAALLVALVAGVTSSGPVSASGRLAQAIRSVPWMPDRPVAKAPIIMFAYQGRTWNHPTRQATQGLEMLGSFDLTGDREYLALAERNAAYLLRRSADTDGALWFAFDFPWNDGDVEPMAPPWYSGLTQAKALSLFSRLYAETGEARWHAAADATFASFDVPRRTGHPWVTFVDAEGQTWIEEYPSDGEADMVLNGHMGAIFGLWDYWCATGSADAEQLIWRASAAVKAKLHEFRRPGGVSFYGLRFHALHPQYHRAHIQQLRTMAQITNDPWYDRQADLFTADVAPPRPLLPLPRRWLAAGAALVAVAGGTYAWARVRRHGRVPLRNAGDEIPG